jgi:hypothetical protein
LIYLLLFYVQKDEWTIGDKQIITAEVPLWLGWCLPQSNNNPMLSRMESFRMWVKFINRWFTSRNRWFGNTDLDYRTLFR